MKIWKCTECSYVTSAEPEGSIGTIHAHAEKHAPGKLLGFKLPTTLWMTADPKILHQYVEKIEVTEYKVIEEEALQLILRIKKHLDPVPTQKQGLSTLTRPTGHRQFSTWGLWRIHKKPLIQGW